MNYIFENLEKGEYLLKVSLIAKSTSPIVLWGNHRQFLINETLSQGEKLERAIPICIKDADFQKQPDYRDTSLQLTLTGDCDASFSIEKAKLPTLYTLGDSTVCNQANIGEGALYRCGGWGQALPLYLNGKYAVSNHAEQGTHTQNCLECHLLKVLEQIKEGDVVLCQFGHNDQKQSWLSAFEGYMENIIKIGKMVAEKGGEFAVCSPINRLIYIDGKLNNYLDDWRDGAKKAAELLGVQYIDLHSLTSALYENLGADAENLFYHSPELDRTHPNDFGAIKIAEFVSAELKKGGKI